MGKGVGCKLSSGVHGVWLGSRRAPNWSTITALDVGSWWWCHVCTALQRSYCFPIAPMSLWGGRSLICLVLGLGASISAAVFLNQLQSGVIFGCILELLDRLGSLLLVFGEAGGKALDAKVVVIGDEGSNQVDADNRLVSC